MRALKRIWDEIFGLFVDDASLAIAILVWLLAMYVLAHTGLVPGVWRGPLLFVGLAAIFAENTLRRARK